MPDDPSKKPPKPTPNPDPVHIEQELNQKDEGANGDPSIAGEIPTADHQQAAMKRSASRSDGKGINADPLSPDFNEATKPLELTPLTPTFNAAAAKPNEKPLSPKLEHRPPTPPTPSGPGGSAQVSPQLRDQKQVDAQAFKEKLLKRRFNEKARDPLDRDR